MKISQNGIDLIKKFEGVRLNAYKCPAGVWTIGYGHTAGVYQGQVITQSYAEALLKADLVIYETKVMKYNDKYDWNQNEFDAMVSFAYNLGSIDSLVENGSRTKEVIASKIELYNKAGGQVLEGLTTRRKAEKALFLTAATNTSNDEIKAVTATNTSAHTQFIQDVQRIIGVSVDGIAGPKTLGATITVSQTKNKCHAIVLPIQKYLNELGYSCGIADGIAGNLFDNAVRNFQTDNNCISDGEITAKAKTWEKLLGLN